MAVRGLLLPLPPCANDSNIHTVCTAEPCESRHRYPVTRPHHRFVCGLGTKALAASTVHLECSFLRLRRLSHQVRAFRAVWSRCRVIPEITPEMVPSNRGRARLADEQGEAVVPGLSTPFKCTVTRARAARLCTCLTRSCPSHHGLAKSTTGQTRR